MTSVVVGYGPDGAECQPVAPKCVAQALLKGDGTVAHYVRSFGTVLLDLDYEPRYEDAQFVAVSARCFELYLEYLRGRQSHQYLAADRHFRRWA